MLTANRNAFHAYKILYYDIPDITPTDPSPASTRQALTVQENLSGTPYRLSERSVAALAAYYAGIGADEDGVEVPDAMIDPAGDIRELEPDNLGRPMYPDFPSQVLEMDETDFRLDQLTHYLSTYGVEQIFSALGTPVQVMEGWLPEVAETPKTRDDDKLARAQIVEVVLGAPAMMETISRELVRPMRMPEPAIALMLDLLEDPRIGEVPEISFHENMMEIIRNAATGSSAQLSHCLVKVAQHPGDILKAVIWTAEFDGVRHLPTRQKKGFCSALEEYPPEAIAANIADLGKSGARAANMLSIARFAGPNLSRAFELVENGQVISFNAKIERAWDSFRESGEPAELLSLYGKRPGVLLRSISRLAKGGVSAEAISAEVSEHADAYSLATLVKLATMLGACDQASYRDFAGNDERRQAQLEAREMEDVRREIAEMLMPVIRTKLAGIETPLSGKKVFLDTGNFSLDGSLIVPNENGNTADAYPPVGMAFDVPADKTVRFFTFWDDRSKRVDVDLHFQGETCDGNRIHIGWNSSFKEFGMVTSGDITHSVNAAEYLDVDMEEACAAGALFITQHQHIFSGAANWKDIATCYSGAMLVSQKEADVKIYNGKNVIFRDDMKGEGNKLDYALIDIPGHWVRILRGAKLPFRNTEFSLGTYIRLLLEAQRCEQVDSAGEADVVLSVGRGSDDDAICLIDNGFFIE